MRARTRPDKRTLALAAAAVAGTSAFLAYARARRGKPEKVLVDTLLALGAKQDEATQIAHSQLGSKQDDDSESFVSALSDDDESLLSRTAKAFNDLVVAPAAQQTQGQRSRRKR